MATPTVCSVPMLREALRVAEELEARLAADGGTDSVQVHLYDEFEERGVMRVELLSVEAGQIRAAYTVDAGEAPGESGVAEQVG
jgi:hypothetical protein